MPTPPKPIRALLIDPTPDVRSVTEIEIEPSLAAYYQTLDCQMIECVYPFENDGEHFLYVDEEFLIRRDRKPHWFMIGDWPTPIGGKALLFRTNDDGDEVPATMPLADLTAQVRFIEILGSLPNGILARNVATSDQFIIRG